MKSITVTELAERTGIPLIDVREVDEFAAGHVPGAVNIPMSEIGNRLEELPAEAFDVHLPGGWAVGACGRGAGVARLRRHERRRRDRRVDRPGAPGRVPSA